ncbi:MAG: hypothetical protein ACXW0O_04880 [Methylosarcina sp.]
MKIRLDARRNDKDLLIAKGLRTLCACADYTLYGPSTLNNTKQYYDNGNN